MTQKIDLRTPFQRAREEKHRSICEAYKELRASHPECSHNRICEVLGENYGMTAQGIKRVVMSEGLYSPQTTTTK